MNVAVIGSGNVATVLARKMANQHRIVHVFSREVANAAILAREMGANFSGYDKIPSVDADIFIIAVADSAVEDIAEYHLHDKLVVHTAGSVSKDVLKNVSLRYGVIYPLQSLRKEMTHIPTIPLLIDANTDESLLLIRSFVSTISDNISVAGDEERLKLHTAAVIACNFTNHMYALAEDFCIHEGVSFNLLKPLILETAQRIMEESPAKVQTGPAARRDIQTLDKHLRLLNNYPKLRTTYLRITDSIINP